MAGVGSTVEGPPVPRIRRLPFQDNIHTSIFTPREYQVELLDAARQHNLIMCLGTIPSKAFVSLMLIRELAHEIRHADKDQPHWTVIIFTSDTAVKRYAGMIRDHTDLTVGEYTTVSDEKPTETELNGSNVLAVTTQGFCNLLEAKLVSLSHVNLVIFGDSHLSVKANHPCQKIAKTIREHQPKLRILGLSANIMKTQCEEPHFLELYMNCLEKMVNCCAETASDMVSLSRFGNRSNEIVVQCRGLSSSEVESDNTNDEDDLITDSENETDSIEISATALESKIRRIVESALAFVTDHVYKPEEIYGNLDDDMNIPDPNIIPKFYLNEILYHLSVLGPWCTNRAARRFLKELKKHKDDTPYERHYLLISMVHTTMEMVHASCEYYFRNMTEVDKILKYSSPKVLRLLDILVHFKPPEVVTPQIKTELPEEKKMDEITNPPSETSLPNESTSNNLQVQLSIHTNHCIEDLCKEVKPNENEKEKSGSGQDLNGVCVNECEGKRIGNDCRNCCLNENLKNNKLKLNNDLNSNEPVKWTPHSGFRRDGHRKDFSFRNRFIHSHLNVDDPNALCGLIFVDRRNTACIMHMLLKELSRHHDDYRFLAPNFLVGYNKLPHHQQQNENRETMLEHRKQEEVLRRFRLHECNLLVTTSVLQEGIDIPKCNLVIRFDLPKDYKAYVQCKGRARASKSQFILLVETSEMNTFMDDIARFKAIEEVLLARCHEREIPIDEEVNPQQVENVLPIYQPRGVEGSAKVTMATAISLVNRYCAKLPSDTFTRLTPNCKLRVTMDEASGELVYLAVLFLPINSPIKKPVIGPAMKSQALAKMAAALSMCQMLHKSGELDDNLLPVGKESVQYEEELMEKWDEEVVPEGAPKPGTTKRRQYYYKRTALAFVGCHPKTDEPNYLYIINMKLSCPIPEEQNTRGRRIYAPEETNRCFGIVTSKAIPKICGFPVFTRSGEVTVLLEETDNNLELTEEQLVRLSFFHNYTFSKVLRLEKYPMKYDPATAESSYFIVPLNKAEETAPLTLDWKFVDLIYTQQNFKPRLIPDTERLEFSFNVVKYQDSVVMPWYRNLDQPQYFYVAEVCYVLDPKSDFPDDEFETFENYYFKKYNIQIQNLKQPLLDVDHTSARLNLLTPRYVNRKGVALPTSSEETKRAKRENLQQKQILVPELCTIHPFPASFWRKAVCLPCVLYRANSLLVAEQLRVRVATEMGLGMKCIGIDFEWPVLDFGWSLADVLKAHAANKEAAAAAAMAKNPQTTTTTTATATTTPLERNSLLMSLGKPKPKFQRAKKEEEPSGWGVGGGGGGGGGFDIGTWTNDMACSKDPQPNKVGAFEGDFFDMINLPTNLQMLNNGDIFEEEEEDAELKELNEVNKRKKDGSGDAEVEEKVKPRIRIGSPSNFEDDGWEFDSGEEVDVMNIPGFSFISVSGGAFNLEDLSRDLEAYEEDGLMQTETFEDDEERTDYPTISYWGGSNDDSGMDCGTNMSTVTVDKTPVEETEEDFKLNWDEVDISEAERIENETVAKEYFESKMDRKKKSVNLVKEDEKVILSSCEEKKVSSKPDCDLQKCREKPAILESPCKNVKDDEFFQTNHPGNPNLDELIHHLERMLEEEEDSGNPLDKAETCDKIVDPAINSVIMRTEVGDDEDKETFSFDRQTSLSSHPGPSPSVILQALTMSNANDGINLERLETIGDSFLKHAITTYLYCTYPNIHEGKLSYLRSKQVSNLNLYRLGKKKGLGECMVATKFEPNDNWLPPGYFVPKELEQALIDSGIPAGHWNIANLPDLQDWKDLDAEQIRKALVKPVEDDGDGIEGVEGEMNTLPQIINEIVDERKAVVVPAGTVTGTVTGMGTGTEDQNEQNPEDLTCFIPYNLMTQHSIPDKSIADCVEALIGAYLISCGPRGALLFMSWLGIKVLPQIKNIDIDDDDDDDDLEMSIPKFGFLNPPPSPLLHIVPNPQAELDVLLDGYDSFEEKIGYKFQDRSYLLQAFTHASYHYNRLSDCYQRLEFLGDAVLDYLITRHLYEDPRQHSPGTLTDLRSALVNNTIFATLAVKHNFHKYFKAICPGLFVVIDKFVQMQKENDHKLNEEYYFIEEDECEEAEDIEVPKALGDVFESVAGAIYLDSCMSLDTVWRVYYNMMKSEIEQFMTNVPKSPIRELLEMEPETAKFGIPEKTLDGKVRVTVEIFGKGKFRGLGRNYRIAKCTAAKHALKALKQMQGIHS